MNNSHPGMFDAIFEGPDSLFGRIFGHNETPAPVRELRIKMTEKQLQRLIARKPLKYKAGDSEITITPPPKPDTKG